MVDKNIKEKIFDTLTEEQKSVQIPYYLHEGEMNRMERINKHLRYILILVFVALIATNAGWIIYESQFDTYSYEQETKADNAPAVGIINTGEGDVTYNGDGETKNQNPGKEEQFQEPVEGVPHL